ncbi:hypothetical protein ALI22I_11405 [Saccharothrix sp. ALI-22-I]|nr:hypothetical protein ALI22I_11405 [Saccharothrix sp. ALI-22-I]
MASCERGGREPDHAAQLDEVEDLRQVLGHGAERGGSGLEAALVGRCSIGQDSAGQIGQAQVRAVRQRVRRRRRDQAGLGQQRLKPAVLA